MKNCCFLGTQYKYDPSSRCQYTRLAFEYKTNKPFVANVVPVNETVKVSTLTKINNEFFSYGVFEDIIEYADLFKGLVFSNIVFSLKNNDSGKYVGILPLTEESKSRAFVAYQIGGSRENIALNYVYSSREKIGFGSGVSVMANFKAIIPTTLSTHWNEDVSFRLDVDVSKIEFTEVELEFFIDDVENVLTGFLMNRLIKAFCVKTGPGNKVEYNNQKKYRVDDKLFTEGCRDYILAVSELKVEGYFPCASLELLFDSNKAQSSK